MEAARTIRDQQRAGTSSADEAKAQFQNALRHLRGMPEVENLIREKLASDAELLSHISGYLLGLGGKRVRPALALLVAETIQPTLAHPLETVIDVAAGIELIHMATLLHDDIIDKSPLRRHQESPFLKFGTTSTLLTGDFLLVRAFSLCAQLDPFVIRATERACVELTEGEILETSLDKERHSVESSLNIARKKTASLFRLAAECGSHLAQAAADKAGPNDEDPVTAEMRLFGENLGLAFQILDDILDATSSEEQLGKKSGLDILERKPSIVNVLWLQSGSDLSHQLLLGEDDQAKREALLPAGLEELRQSEAIEAARDLARTYAQNASSALLATEDAAGALNAAGLQALRALLDYTVKRVM